MKTSLYRYYDSENALLYVGVSHHPFRREMQHGASDKDMPEVRYIELEWFDTREIALAAEKLAIRRERPSWNLALEAKPRKVAKTPRSLLPKQPKPVEAKPVVPVRQEPPTQGPALGRKVFGIGNVGDSLCDHVFMRHEFSRLRKVCRPGDMVVFGGDVTESADEIRALIDYVDGKATSR